MARRTDDDASNCDAQRHVTSGVTVNLPESVRDNLGMLRRLHHRMVDITADAGFVATLADEAERRLEALSSSMVAQYVVELLAEAYSPARKSRKTKKSKKIAKRSSKRRPGGKTAAHQRRSVS